MPAYTVHDVRVTPEKRELPPEDGWQCWELTGVCSLQCSCGYTEGPIANATAQLIAHQHILSGA
jgi:hypothetical protein